MVGFLYGRPLDFVVTLVGGSETMEIATVPTTDFMEFCSTCWLSSYIET